VEGLAFFWKNMLIGRINGEVRAIQEKDGKKIHTRTTSMDFGK
jgi:hypothetical protein